MGPWGCSQSFLRKAGGAHHRQNRRHKDLFIADLADEGPGRAKKAESRNRRRSGDRSIDRIWHPTETSVHIMHTKKGRLVLVLPASFFFYAFTLLLTKKPRRPPRFATDTAQQAAAGWRLRSFVGSTLFCECKKTHQYKNGRLPPARPTMHTTHTNTGSNEGAPDEDRGGATELYIQH